MDKTKLPRHADRPIKAYAALRRIAARFSRRVPAKGMAVRVFDAVPALYSGADLLTDAFAAVASRKGRLQKSLFVAVILPTVLFWFYATLWQSPRYVAETKLTVREAERKNAPKLGDAASIIARISGGAASRDVQNATMVMNYIKSRAILHDLGGRAFLEAKFSTQEADYFSRLRKGADIEDLSKYWLSHLSASVENMSGILTVKADAFTPDDARDIVSDVVRLSEALINKITLRNRGDALERAEDELRLARGKLASARERVLDFRTRNLVLDPGARATSLGEVILKLTLERIDLVNALSTFSSALATDAPSQRLQRTRLSAIDQQLAELRKKLTDAQGPDAVSSQLAAYENLKLEEQFAERLCSIAQSAYENARQDLERQQLYLVTIVRPTLPEAATFPRVFANTALLFCTLLVIWAIVSLIVASIEDQMI